MNAQFESEQAAFRPSLELLLRSYPNSNTVEGLTRFSHQAQRILYSARSTQPDSLNSLVNRSRAEFGSRVPPTLLDRNRISRTYETDNLNAWLRDKRLQVSYRGVDETVWHRGLPEFQGASEPNLYFRDEEMSLGTAVVLLDHVGDAAARFAAMTRSRNVQDEFDKTIFGVISAVSRTVSLEIRTLSISGHSPERAVFQAQLSEPLERWGLHLSPR